MMDWYLENEAGVEYQIDVDKWKLELHTIFNKFTPNKANVTLSRNVPTTTNQWIRAVENGKTAFLGYIVENPQSYRESQKTIVAYGVENQLWECPCPLQTYWGKSVYLSQVFGHADPDTTTDKDNIPGLLFAANSLIPPGWREDTLPADTDDRWIAHGPGEIIDATNGIVRYPNMGTRSRVGAATIFVDGYPYTDVASYADMASGTAAVWREADHLYIRFWQSGALVPHFRNAPVFAKNAFDTRCRFGSIETDSVLDVQLLVDSGIMAGDVILNLTRSTGQYLRFVYIGKLCYMYVVANFDDLGETEILESECDKIKFSPSAELNPDAVTGAGHGSNNVRQFQSIFSTKPGTAYIRRVADFPFTFFDKNQTLYELDMDAIATVAFTPTAHHGMLFENTLAQWRESKKGSQIELELVTRNAIKPGSALRLMGSRPVTDPNVLICSVERDQSGLSRVVAGSEQATMLDAKNGIQAVNAAYSTCKNDFNVVAELYSDTIMVGIAFDWPPYPYTQPAYTHYISTYSTRQNASAWGYYLGGYAPTIAERGIPYYTDNNIRMLLDLELDVGDRPQFERGKCYLFPHVWLGNTGWAHFESNLGYNPQEEDIQGWDITPYILYGDASLQYAFEIIIYSSDLFTVHWDSEFLDWSSGITAKMRVTLVELGYTSKRIAQRTVPSRCGGLELY